MVHEKNKRHHVAALYILLKAEARDEVILYLLVALPFKLKDADAREGVIWNASESKIDTKNDRKKWSIMHTRSGKVVNPWYCT